MENDQEQQELWWAPLYVKDADIAYAIKIAVLNYVEKRENQSTPENHQPPHIPQLRTLIVACGWTRGNALIISAKTHKNEITAIHTAIDQHKTYHAVLAALTEWKNDCIKERQQKGLPEFTPAYLNEQRKSYDNCTQYGIYSPLFYVVAFCANHELYSYLSNRQAIIWLQNFITIKANAPIATAAPEKPETESQTPKHHTGNTSTQHQEQPTHTALSRAEMSQYKPTDWDLIDELCNARESNWENAYIGHNRWNQGESSDYGTYLKGVAINFPAIPLLNMLTPTEWREKPLTFIINQIQTSPEEYSNTIKNIIDRYKTAARKKLIDIAYRQWISCSTNSPENTNREKKFKKYSDAPILDNSDIPPPNVRYNAPGKNGEPGEPYNDCTVYDFLGNLFEEAKLVKKVITLQELQKLLEKTQPTYRPEHLTHSTNTRPTNTSEFQPSDREMLIEIKKAVHEFMQDPTAPGIDPYSWDSAYQKYNNRFSIIWNSPPKTGTSLLHDLISDQETPESHNEPELYPLIYSALEKKQERLKEKLQTRPNTYFDEQIVSKSRQRNYDEDVIAYLTISEAQNIMALDPADHQHNKKPLSELNAQEPQTVASQAKAEVIAAIKRKGLNGNWPKEYLWSEIKIIMAELDCTKELAIENFILIYSVHLTAVMPGRTKENFKANITKALSGKI